MISSFVPFVAFGETVKTNTNQSANKFCSQLSIINSKTADKITKAEEKESTYQTNRNTNFAKKQSVADEKKALVRTNADAKRATNWDKMINKAKTDDQKTAVTTYKTAVQTAIDARRTAVDATIKTYRDGLAQIIVTNTGSVNTATTTFKASVTSALEKARTDCANNVSSKTVKADFTKAVNDAKTILKASRKDATTNSEAISLKKTRDDAIKLIEITFKTATDKAHADLVLALKK